MKILRLHALRRFLFVCLGAIFVICWHGLELSPWNPNTQASTPSIVIAQVPNHLMELIQRLPTSMQGWATTMVEGDRFYRDGNIEEAEARYRQVKSDFATTATTSQIVTPLYDVEELDAENIAYWDTAQAALDADEEEAAIAPLQTLVNNEPSYIPATLQLAEVLQEEDEEEEAIAVLEQAATLHPYSAEIVMAQVEALADEKDYLEASIAAREFALLNLDHPQSAEFQGLADEYFRKFSRRRRRNSILGGIGNIITGVVTGDRVPWESLDSVVETADMVKMMLASESEFGAAIASQYKDQLPLVDDPDVLDYVTQLGLEMARPMGRDFDYEFYVVQDPALNAFALPGGKIFVNTGTILGSNSQAELAGVLAHEAAHSVLSHGIQSFFRDDLLGQLADEVPMGEFVTTLTSLHYSRRQERQSDILGNRVLATSGYAADGLRNFMATLAANTADAAPPEYLSSHPASSSRVEYLEELIQRNGYNRYALEGMDKHLEIQARLH
ncbi:MAG: M48 family metalloprotease [Merismopedia sp. SIO2A8]|nr:M48 family metalloprotease [Symploca sp. SIO2B6]NET47771.1 M48 family metalloprotease [Merismopedia sp. SIO2A8]